MMGFIIAAAILVYLLLCLLLYHLGESKMIRGWRLAVISLIFTPLVGFLVYYLSGNRMVVLETRYVCPECKYEFTHEVEFCPICSTEEHRIKLVAEKRNMV